jgi:hypothetical protein
MAAPHGIDRSGGSGGSGAPGMGAAFNDLADPDKDAIPFWDDSVGDFEFVGFIGADTPTDGDIWVGDGTNWVKESGATARASLGLHEGISTGTIIDALGDTIVGSGSDAAVRAGFSPSYLNGSLTAAVAGNALTVSLKGTNGNDPSPSNAVYIPFRNVTPGTGTPVMLAVTAALSVTVSSGSTLGSTDNTPFRFWIVAFNDGSTVRLGIVNCFRTDGILPLGTYQLLSSTAEGGAGAADSAGVVYTGTAVASKAFAVIGYVDYAAGLAAAGTYSSAPTTVQIFGPGIALPSERVQLRRTDTSAVATGTTTTPIDDTIPQHPSEGTQFMTQAVDFTCTMNAYRVKAQSLYTSSNVSTAIVIALHQDTTSNALKAVAHFGGAGTGTPQVVTLEHYGRTATVSSTTFRIRAGPGVADTITFNGAAGGRLLGGVINSYLEVEEIMG